MGFSLEFWVTTALAVVGITISILLSRKTSKGRLSVGVVRSANLMSEVVRVLPNLKVLYENEVVEDELVWIFGILINTGDQDIGKSIVSQFPILRLPEGAAWQEFSVDPKNGKDADKKILNPSDVQVTWSLLKPYESIRFTALIRTKDRSLQGRLQDGSAMRVDARIENVNSAFEPNFAQYATVASLRRQLPTVFFPFVFTIIMSIAVLFPLKDNTVAFEVPHHTGLYTISQNENGETRLTEVDGTHSINIAGHNFSANNIVQVKIPRQKKWWDVVISAAMIFTFLSFCIIAAARLRTSFKSYRYLNSRGSIWDILLFWKKLPLQKSKSNG